MSDDAEAAAAPTEQELLQSLDAFEAGQDPLETTLQADDRVIARVTDGIYRQPGSALRELISNAYDADATRVAIDTDRPRFRRIRVEDNGNGMSTDTLVRLIYHIGGSAKRTREGERLGITSTGDPDSSPSGRPLIGKIGIGLFSVAQLTQAFQVITKRRGERHRTVASVVMKQYTDNTESTQHAGEKYSAGRVRIWKEPAADVESQGTTIVLDAIRPQTRDTLRSRGTWQAILGDSGSFSPGSERLDVKPPMFHIGTVTAQNESILEAEQGGPRLPWEGSDPPDRAFRKLVDSVWDSINRGVPNPNLEQLLDYYLRMAWHLSVWAPLPYMDCHPFDVTLDAGLTTYALSGGGVELLTTTSSITPRSLMDLHAGQLPSELPFQVLLDDLELSRPVRLLDLPTTSGAAKTPLLFFGKHREEFAGIDENLSGGTLAFESYILWAPKIAPTEHHGILVRVHDATGSLYDETFLSFPVAEQRRMTQLTCEIFVSEGFDGALNIDRESFNYAHPHVVVLTKWVHAALRRVIAEEKRVAAAALAERRAMGERARIEALDEIVDEVWERERGDDGTAAPTVIFSDDPDARVADGYIFPRRRVLGEYVGANARGRQRQAEAGIGGIMRVLSAFGLLDTLSTDDIAELAIAIRKIVQAGER